MGTCARAALLIAVLGLGTFLAGCPGMPGASGREQTVPPGVLPPPGLESGGARTLMGATITPPDNHFLLVKYRYAREPADEGEWQSCRRFIPLDSCLLVEGLNFDGRREGAEKDVNKLLPYIGLADFFWKYEAKPAPPEEEESKEKGD